MASQTSYAYKIYLEYRNGSKSTVLDSNSIKMLMIDYDYYKNNMPSIYMTINLKISIYNEMILKFSTSKIYLKITKYKKGDKTSVEKKYIESLFDYYFTSSNIEYNQKYLESTNSEDTSYRVTALGLIDNTLVKRNKKLINCVVHSSKLSSIIHNYTNNMKMIMEPLKNNPTVSNFIIPPIDSTAKLISYLNDYYSLYSGDYIYFLDFDKTYLISTMGKGIDISDNTYKSIKIDILSGSSDTSDYTLQGVIEDSKQKIYIIKIYAKNTNISIDKMMEKKLTKVMAIDTMGNTSTKSLGINKNDDTVEKTKVIRVNSIEEADSIKAKIDSSSVILSIAKNDIDTSILVPYKEFYINNIDEYKSYNGRYQLISKKEVYIAADDGFYCSVLANFRKVE